MRNRTRVIAAAAAVTAALTAGGTTTAMASTTGAKPATHAKTVSTTYRCAPASDLAARLGVSTARLDRALRTVKMSLSTAGAKPTEGQFDAALARALHVSQAKVRHAFAAEKPCASKAGAPKTGGPKPGGPKPGGPKPAPSEQQGHEALAMAVAKELHISMAKVDAALQPLFAVGHADPSSAVFTAAARALGITPDQLDAALVSAKESLATSN